MHYQRSVKRVSDRVNKGSSTKAHRAFTKIAHAIPAIQKKEQVEILFQVLCGAKPLSSATAILSESSLLREYEPDHNVENWTACTHWCNWWTRQNHKWVSLVTVPWYAIISYWQWPYYNVSPIDLYNMQECSHLASRLWILCCLKSSPTPPMLSNLTTALVEQLTGSL